MEKKRANDDSVPAPLSKAAKFNSHALKKLRAAIDDDPEIDLVTKLPMDYSVRLETMRESSRTESSKFD